MKELDKLEKYVVAPNVGFYGGYRFDGEDIRLCNDHDVDEGYHFHVEQKIVNSVLITDVERELTMANGKKVKEKSHQEVELEENQLLLYVVGTGFTIPGTEVCMVDEAIEQYQLLKG